MAKKYALIVDVTRCDGCGSCLIAVKDEYAVNNYPGYCAPQPMEGQNWLDVKEVTYGQNWKVKVDNIPVMFPHDRNLDVSKIPDCPEGAVYVREDGITIIDPEKARGHKGIYEYFNKLYPGTCFWNEELQLPQIYILDAHRLDEKIENPTWGDKEIRCSESCPTQALHWGDLNDPESHAAKWVAEHGTDLLEDYFPHEGADYIVKYYRLPKPFIAGEVLREDMPLDCVEGAKVTCKCPATGEIFETTTNFLGDFQFKYLKQGAEYEVTCEVEGYQNKILKVTLDTAKDLGTIVVQK